MNDFFLDTLKYELDYFAHRHKPLGSLRPSEVRPWVCRDVAPGPSPRTGQASSVLALGPGSWSSLLADRHTASSLYPGVTFTWTPWTTLFQTASSRPTPPLHTMQAFFCGETGLHLQYQRVTAQ